MAPVTSASAPAEAATRVSVFTRATVLRWPTVDRDQERDEQDRDDVRDLDHRVDRGPRRVLVRVADRVARDRGRVGLRALAAVLSVLDQLLRVVPRTAARRHRD